MKEIIAALQADPKVTGYKIVEDKKESRELFFVKGALETVRSTDTKDLMVTVYVDHDGAKGDSSFPVYPSTTPAELKRLVEEAAEKALLIRNEMYALPAPETGEYRVESNLDGHDLAPLAETVARAVFSARIPENASLNSVEVFVTRRTGRVVNSLGLDKTQVRHGVMVEAIPTYNGERQSVELYQQLNFSSLDEAAIRREVEEKLEQAKARYEAVRPDRIPPCAVILNKGELASLCQRVAGDMNYATVYNKTGLFHKGDAVQKDPTGDRLTVTMRGELPGSVGSARFDGDGLSLRDIKVIDNGVAVNYYGSSRYGQYLGEEPTGALHCMEVAPGSACAHCLSQTPYLEVLSMSGLQVDPFNDYIGGEVRLAWYHDGEKRVSVTGISIAGKLSEVLSTIRLSKATALHNSYAGPEKAILQGMKIF